MRRTAFPCSPSFGAWLALAAALALGACTHAKKEKDKEAGEKLSPEQEKALDEYRAEVEIGRNMAGRLLGYYGIIEDEKLIGYVNQIAGYVASYSDFPDRRYMIAILKHEGVNAFACPGGYILITMGALRAANNEAELAAILGHEITHVGKKHMFDTLRRMKEKDLAEAAKKRETGGKMEKALRVRERPEVEDTAAGAMLARYLSGTAGASLNVLAAAQAGMTLITEKGLDPQLEYEADHEGVKFAIRAGYEPKAMLNYLKRLEDKNKKITKNLETTHPPIKERRHEIAKLLKSLKAEDIVGATGEERFDKVRKSFPAPEN
jgi:predicted Zn-dependent protease